MFSNMLNHVEDKHKNEKMPVRNFYNNTFGELVNGALFALNKKISKAKDDEANELQLCEGKIKFLALYIINPLRGLIIIRCQIKLARKFFFTYTKILFFLLPY